MYYTAPPLSIKKTQYIRGFSTLIVSKGTGESNNLIHFDTSTNHYITLAMSDHPLLHSRMISNNPIASNLR